MQQPESHRVLVVDDNPEMARMLSESLADEGYLAVPCSSGREAIERIEHDDVDVVVTDLRMPDADGLEVLAAARRKSSELPVIIMTAFSAVDTAIESIRRGAYHYLTKPFKTEELLIFLSRALDAARVRNEARALRSELHQRYSLAGICSESPAMARVLEVARQVIDTDVPVLISGETGTGKGLLAGALHSEGKRARGPFVSVNCVALPEALLESELFGHVKGAFTGAVASRQGLFAQASGGTLFLDEIGDMALPLQGKLLHALEHGAVRPVGAETERPVDVRIVAATNRDLRDAARRGTFREDLLYRLDVVAIEVPPLRRRPEDILPLAARFLERAKARYPRSPVVRLAPATADCLLGYDWPGNVRELEHVIERLAVLGRNEAAMVDELPDALRGASGARQPPFGGEIIPIRELERRYAEWALQQNGGHRGRTAESLGIDEKTLWRWLNDRSERASSSK